MAKAKGSEATSDVERLIEMGLNRYGAGDLDGAIFLWEEALAVDPDNEAATSYIDYVRLNFDVLSSEPSVEEPSESPYAIEETPEYQINATPEQVDPTAAKLPQAAALIALGAVDDGWFADEETHDAVTVHRGAVDIEIEHPPDEGGTLDMEADAPALEMEAEEPPAPAPIEMEADEPPSAVDFDAGATRKFHGDAPEAPEPVQPPADDLDYMTAGPTTGFFRGDELSNGQTMGFFRDDTATNANTHRGFGSAAPKRPADLEPNEFSDDPETDSFNSEGTPVGFANLETEVRKRDFGFVRPGGAVSSEAPPSLGSAPTEDKISFDATLERDPFGGTSNGPADASSDDLLDSLPTPRPLGSDPESGEIRLSPSQTLDFPEASRVPASNRDTPSGALRANAVLSAPTREIGTRPGGRPLANPDDDDMPTGQSDVRAIRDASRRIEGAQSKADPDGTRKDIVLAIDPIAAAAGQILDEVDADAPAGESQDDQTRRRISRLLEKAGDWSEAGELDKAVSAVELALSEDANSALAQKLITRNKDTIMALFQAFLGDLDRTPQLAKPLHELGKEPISPRAAFLLSRIDGMLTIDELLDVSGMPRMEAYRHLCQLFLRGILR